VMTLLKYLAKYMGHVRHLEVIAPDGARASFSIPRSPVAAGASYRENNFFRLHAIQTAIEWHMGISKPGHTISWAHPSELVRLRKGAPDSCRFLGVFYSYNEAFSERSSENLDKIATCARALGFIELHTRDGGFFSNPKFSLIASRTSSLIFAEDPACKGPQLLELVGCDFLTSCKVDFKNGGSRLVTSCPLRNLRHLAFTGSDSKTMCDDLSRLSCPVLQCLVVSFQGELIEKPPRLLSESSVVPNLTTLRVNGKLLKGNAYPHVDINCSGAPRLAVIELKEINCQMSNTSDGKAFQGKIMIDSPERLLAPSIGVKPTPKELEIRTLIKGDESSLDGLLAGIGAPGDAIDARSLVCFKLISDEDGDRFMLEERPVVNLGVAFQLETLHLENAVIDFGSFSCLRLKVLVLRFCTVRNMSAIVLPPNTVLENCHDGTHPIPNEGKCPYA